MPRITFVPAEGADVTVDAPVGTNVMKAALSSMVPGIIGECGGDLVCATCHVFVRREWADKLPAITDEEAEMLEVTSEEPTDCSRLACQIEVTDELDGLTVDLPRTQR